MEILILCVQIFFVRILDVSMGTVRAIITVKGKKFLSSLIGFVEVLIWFLIVREAFNTELESIWIALTYSAGYATGTFIGGILSDIFISGTLTVQAILSSASDEIVTSIRKAGFAVTVIDVKGQASETKYMLLIEIQKKRSNDLKKLIKKLDEKAFIFINETKAVENGYFK